MNKVSIVLTVVALLGAIALVIQLSEIVLAQQQEQPTPFVVQDTKQSVQDPLPGHETHQVVIAAPLRDDGKIYSGIVSFTASQPVEAVILHKYNLVSNSSAIAEPFNTSVNDSKFAASVMKQFTESQFNAGSFVFAGNALAFHNLKGNPFIVTYTVDGDVSSLTQ
ncbi:MAG: hypothetical protein P0116_01885 [Candidatus Nitrosocosmicus sp.]|nr:hypothetical protein [Candidatus Nitrosocosmicus sp.]